MNTFKKTMQDEVLRLILLALEDGSALSRKVLVLFVVQKLTPRYPRASKTNVGHVVQLLYRASCFKLQKREDDSSLMQLKEEFRNYEALRKEHDAQIIQIAMDACLKITPESWSSLLYGDVDHRSQMQSIIDRLQMTQSQSFSGMLRELQGALQRTNDPYDFGSFLPDFDYIDKMTKEESTLADEISSELILAILIRIKKMVVACSNVTVQKHRSLPFNGSSFKTFGSNCEISNCAQQYSVPMRYLTDKRRPKSSNLSRNWSSMSSVINVKSKQNYNDLNDAFTSIDETPWNDKGIPTIISECQNDQLSNSTDPSKISNLKFYPSENNLSPSSESLCDENDDYSHLMVQWRNKRPSCNFHKGDARLPPRSPVLNNQPQCSNFRPWVSSVNIPQGFTQHELNRTDDDRYANDFELQKLIRISNTIRDLEKQKQHLIERLNDNEISSPMISRNAQSTTNLHLSDYSFRSSNQCKSSECLLQSQNNKPIGFLTVNDQIVPFCQVPVHNKYGPISRSNRRLAQSLLSFPPVHEANGDIMTEESEDNLYENATRVVSHVLNDDYIPTLKQIPLLMKHTQSMSAIPDNLNDTERIFCISHAFKQEDDNIRQLMSPQNESPSDLALSNNIQA